MGCKLHCPPLAHRRVHSTMVTYFMIYSTSWIEFTLRKLSWSLDKCLAHCIKVAHGAYLVHIAMTI